MPDGPMRQKLMYSLILAPSTLKAAQTAALPWAGSGCQSGAVLDVHDEGSASLLQHAAHRQQRRLDHGAASRSLSTTFNGARASTEHADLSFGRSGRASKPRQPNRGGLLHAHFSGSEVVLILIGCLGVTSMFLMGVAAYQQGHECLERYGKTSKDVGQRQREAGHAVSPSGMEASVDGSPRHSPLVVPSGKRLKCHVQCGLHRARQNVDFQITSPPNKGQQPLLQVRVKELHEFRGSPRITLQHVGTDEQVAAASTGSLHEHGLSEGNCIVNILNPAGETLALIKKESDDTYSLIRSSGNCLTFRGRLRAHNINVMHEDLPVAKVEPVGAGDGAYRVVIEEQVDAGLVLIGLLAIDKCERLPPDGGHIWYPEVGSFFPKRGTSEGWQ
mmetsp:Transcript_57662/g.134308  ORF Transcript_57662/g.134308 Transcript_57662/m.134308 type:complete len:388 (+) Transcript_57662:124-1287(+)